MNTQFDPSTALANGDLRKVPITEITPDAAGLRKNVNKKDEKWAGLVASVRRDGIMQAITVRRNTLPNAEHPFIVVDGLHRWSAAMEIWEELNAERLSAGEEPLDPSEYLVPVNLIEVTCETDVYRLQLTANLQTIDTRPVQIREHLLAIIAAAKADDIELTQADLANEINKSQTYVSNILKLTNLTGESSTFVDENRVSASNAFNLAKLPAEEQVHWHDRAKTLDSEEFALQIGQEIKKIKDAESSERRSRGDEFPGVVPKLVSKAEALSMMDGWIKEHFEDHGGDVFINKVLEEVNTEGNEASLNAFLVGTYYGFQRFLQIDSETVERKKAEHTAKVAEKNRKKALADSQKEQEDAAQRGVNILMPAGKSKPTGFGGIEVGVDTPDQVEEEASA